MEIAKLMLKFIFYFILNFKYLNPLLLILLKSNPFTNERERERERKETRLLSQHFQNFLKQRCEGRTLSVRGVSTLYCIFITFV